MSDPVYYSDLITSKGEKVEIRRQFEICQGGPSIGYLFVNGKHVAVNSLFGGPILEFNGSLILPKREKGWFFNGFKLMSVDLNTFEIKYLGVKSDLLFIKRIDKNHLYYSKTLDDSSEEFKLRI